MYIGYFLLNNVDFFYMLFYDSFSLLFVHFIFVIVLLILVIFTIFYSMIVKFEDFFYLLAFLLTRDILNFLYYYFCYINIYHIINNNNSVNL